jgi:hypothetical protein
MMVTQCLNQLKQVLQKSFDFQLAAPHWQASSRNERLGCRKRALNARFFVANSRTLLSRGKPPLAEGRIDVHDGAMRHFWESAAVESVMVLNET